jgi:GH18 family chitinase
MLPGPLIEKMKPYSSVNYGFAFLVQQPNPDQDGCGNKAPAGKCPVWDGNNIYLSKAAMQGSHLVDSSTTLEESSPGGIAIGEVVRMGRMHPDGPKRVKIVLGGWSDYARLETVDNARKVGKLMAKAVQITFADGVDLDFEHLSPFDTFAGADEFGAFAALISSLRSELDQVASSWEQSARKRHAALNATYHKLEPWQRQNVKEFYATQFTYLEQVAANPPPHLEISWTTRFNAWVPAADPYNYAEKPLPAWALNSTFESDNEGAKFYSNVSDLVDTINVMAYDATGLKFNYSTIFNNFANLGGVDLRKVNMGFEPGEQAASGVWEGLDKDKEVAKYVKDKNIGGCMIWAMNPSPKQAPTGSKLCPKTAAALNPILEPTYAWGPPPKYTKCDPSTGYLPK